ncbi:MAG: phhB [Rhodocyclaceae bacterium]|nr:phhB [Rhodocyclaceae bacterium]
MNSDTIAERLRGLAGWSLSGNAIAKEFRFPDFDAAMAFVNAVADIAREEDHHPDLEVGYSRVRVSYTTHSAGGLSERDFASATRVEQLPGR